MKRIIISAAVVAGVCAAFLVPDNTLPLVAENLEFATEQLKIQSKVAEKNPLSFPRTINAKGEMIGTNMYDWTSGFFPGNLWYAYEFTREESIKKSAIRWTERLAPLQYFTRHHDLGFMMYCSYGNAYRLTGDEKYKAILIQSAKSLATRFNPKVKSIKSWEGFRSWSDQKRYTFPVIIDNLMNLELLFFASRVTGDEAYRDIALQHAETSLKYHIRPDFSSYHVVCYDTATGRMVGQETGQGYSNNSTWSRGQAWGIYGFLTVYRETKDPKYLQVAEKMADWVLEPGRLPSDYIPYWDYNAYQEGYQPGIHSNAFLYRGMPRDASAAAVMASGLLELSTYSRNGKKYREAAEKMLQSLSGKAYQADAGTNGHFILKHSVGSIPHGVELDVPLVYADYYYLEALLRLDKLSRGGSLF
jgi:chondroitin AC lyase